MIARFLPLTILLLVAIIPRLPFLGIGYGLDPDAYENITTAQQIAAGGGYVASRLPGYPVHEILLFLTMAYKAPIAANLISLVAFVAATLGLHDILRRIDPRTALPFTAAFAAMPVGFAPSVEAMDYFLSLALVILSLLMLMRERANVSAAALGIASASRITNGAVLLAVLPLIDAYKKADAKRPRIIYVAIVGLFGLVFFSPVLLTYGAGFFSFYDDPTHPSVRTILTAGLFGSWGLVGGAVAIGLSILAARNIWADRSILSTPLFQAGMVLIFLFWIAFFRLPHEVPYLLPAIVGFLIVLSLTIRSALVVWMFAAAVALSSFVSIGPNGVSPGPIPSYYEARSSQTDVLACFFDRLYDFPENAMLIAPTHPEWAYFRQGAGLNRPDIKIEKWHRYDPENPGPGPVFKLESSILDRSGPGCAAVINQIHPPA